MNVTDVRSRPRLRAIWYIVDGSGLIVASAPSTATELTSQASLLIVLPDWMLKSVKETVDMPTVAEEKASYRAVAKSVSEAPVKPELATPRSASPSIDSFLEMALLSSSPLLLTDCANLPKQILSDKSNKAIVATHSTYLCASDGLAPNRSVGTMLTHHLHVEMGKLNMLVSYISQYIVQQDVQSCEPPDPMSETRLETDLMSGRDQ